MSPADRNALAARAEALAAELAEVNAALAALVRTTEPPRRLGEFRDGFLFAWGEAHWRWHVEFFFGTVTATVYVSLSDSPNPDDFDLAAKGEWSPGATPALAPCGDHPHGAEAAAVFAPVAATLWPEALARLLSRFESRAQGRDREAAELRRGRAGIAAVWDAAAKGGGA